MLNLVDREGAAWECHCQMVMIQSRMCLGFSWWGLRAPSRIGALTGMINAYVCVPGGACCSLPHKIGNSCGTPTGLEEYHHLREPYGQKEQVPLLFGAE